MGRQTNGGRTKRSTPAMGDSRASQRTQPVADLVDGQVHLDARADQHGRAPSGPATGGRAWPLVGRGLHAWPRYSSSISFIRTTFGSEPPPSNSDSQPGVTICLASSEPITRAPIVRTWASLLLRARSAE
jgi:hypothetical protein